MTAVTSICTADDQRAHVNYMLHCQGCHLSQGEGVPGSVPTMKNFAGYFLHSQEGREFLIRVPGVSRSALSAAEIAELMNWYLQTHSSGQLPIPFEAFTAAEVADLRANPIGDPENARVAILADIAEKLPPLAAMLNQEE